ncbi:uncharacterized protein LOC110038970 [Phalaenopsis equestris]|uniref:uncharacterized protein LOC110038970 n=1 Tax=Phalaenopsis equestris TaxID=78828 RepID=UPI0009E2C242|nr:uncharacterized protein LOC110038970 [Phalaenopsis equestris]
MDGDEELTPKLVETNFSANRVMAIKHNEKKEHCSVFMDGILHRIPFGRKVMEAMKKSKSGLWDVSTMEKFDREGKLNSCWNKFNKHVPRNIQRSHSLSDSVAKYSHLFESLSKEEFKNLPEGMKVKSLDRRKIIPEFNCFDSLLLQIHPKLKSKFNYVKEILRLNIQHDVEDVEEELESLIQDDFLDDSGLQLFLLPSFNHFLS